jgi:transposase
VTWRECPRENYAARKLRWIVILVEERTRAPLPLRRDLNPIEMVFAKLKARLRRAAERSIDALWHRVGAFLRDFSHEECAAYFRAAGYAPL